MTDRLAEIEKSVRGLRSRQQSLAHCDDGMRFGLAADRIEELLALVRRLTSDLEQATQQLATARKFTAKRAADRILAKPEIITDLLKSLQEEPEPWDDEPPATSKSP